MKILSTLPHFYSIYPVLPYYHTYTKGYIHTIILSSMFSIFYHIDESNLLIKRIDYSLAFIWFLYDIYMGYDTKCISRIFLANMISCIFHFMSDHDIYHSIWHIINAYKCYYVSQQIELGILLMYN